MEQEGVTGDVLDALYQAVVDPDSYTLFAARLAHLCNSDLAAFVHISGDSSIEAVLAVHGGEPVAFDGWSRARLTDPYLLRVLAKPDRAWRASELVTESELTAGSTYRSLMLPLGMRDVMASAHRVPQGSRSALFLVMRAEGAGPYTDGEKRRFERLGPHLRRFGSAAAGARRPATTLREDVACAALNHIGCSIVVVDSKCVVRHLNHMARSLLDDDDGIAIHDDTLVPRSPGDRRALTRMVHELTCAKATSRPKADIHAVAIHRGDDRPPLHLQAFRLATPAAGNAVGDLDAGLVMIVLTDPARRPEVPAELLHQLYNLTRSEARLAARLAHGDALNDVAQTLGIKLSTARSHLRSTFAKTGTSRQAELVALLMAGAQWRPATDPGR